MRYFALESDDGSKRRRMPFEFCLVGYSRFFRTIALACWGESNPHGAFLHLVDTHSAPDPTREPVEYLFWTIGQYRYSDEEPDRYPPVGPREAGMIAASLRHVSEGDLQEAVKVTRSNDTSGWAIKARHQTLEEEVAYHSGRLKGLIDVLEELVSSQGFHLDSY
jgi:hypothetical protein